MAESESRRPCRGRVRIADVAGNLHVRVAGSSSAVPRPGSACSAYLVQTANARVLLDCGSGALQSLQRYIDPLTLDAVVISHFHPDHVFDLVALRYLWAFAKNGAAKLDVFVHAGGAPRLHRLALAAASSEGERFFERSMRVRDYSPQRVLRVGDLRISFAATRHYIDAYAMRVSNGPASVVYSADTAPCPAVAGLARGADLFICESALGADGIDRDPRGHCNAREAGGMAQEAGVNHLLLTHYGADSAPKDLAAAAAREFGGRISVAEDGWWAAIESGTSAQPDRENDDDQD